jgi:flavin-dependent dehydrogenase
MAEPERWDAIVVGAGPAGSVAAFGLARQGKRVLLVDRSRFPRDKVCGSCLGRAGVTLLREMGLDSVLAGSAAQRVHRAEVYARGRCSRFAWEGGVVVPRRDFDHALVEAARGAGASFEHGCSAQLMERSHAGVRIRLTDWQGARDAWAGVAIAADGLSGRFASSAGICPQVLRGARIGLGAIIENARLARDIPGGCVRMAVGSRGYVGMVRIDDARLDVAAAIDPGVLRECGNPGSTIEAIARESGANFSLAQDVSWRGTGLLTRRVAMPESERVLAIGDAAGYVEPITGSGMSWAIATGARVVAHARALMDGHLIAGAWTQDVCAMLAIRRWRCSLVSAIVRRPRVLNLGLAAASACRVGGIIASRVNERPWDRSEKPTPRRLRKGIA